MLLPILSAFVLITIAWWGGRWIAARIDRARLNLIQSQNQAAAWRSIQRGE